MVIEWSYQGPVKANFLVYAVESILLYKENILITIISRNFILIVDNILTTHYNIIVEFKICGRFSKWKKFY